MAKKSAVNKSQAIRDALRDNPAMSPKEIADLLTSQGMKVGAQYVSAIKSSSKAKSKRRVVRRKPSTKPSSSGAGPVAAALDFIRAAGGLDQAQEILRTVEKIKAAAG